MVAVDCRRSHATWLGKFAFASLFVLGLILASPASAVQRIQADSTAKHALTHPVVTPDLKVLPDPSSSTTLAPGANAKPGVDQFLARTGGNWIMRWDARAGRPNLIQGSGVALIPGKGNDLRAADIGLAPGQAVDLDKLETLLRGFVDRNANLFGVKGLEFRLDKKSSVPYGDGTTHWFVHFNQYYQGVKVDNAYLYFRLSHGNIVQFGSYRVAPVALDVRPGLTRDNAFDAAFEQVPFKDDVTLDRVVEEGELLIMPTSANSQPLGVNYAGVEGQGYGHRLVWRFVFQLKDDTGTYEVLLDAHSNQLLQVRDLTVNVQATVTGGIYPESNLDPEINVPLPFVDVVDNGSNETTDVDGNYDYSGAGNTASADLGGAYYDINDTCGAISLSSTTDGNLDFGTSGGTDCVTPGVGGAGNTHSSRSAFYHLTLINRNADTYYPSNAWLDGTTGVNVNLNQTCNAFWDGFNLNFFKSGGGCANTGELSGVFLHEWGHGFDDNIGVSAPEYGSGEAIGDTFAFIYNRDPCIGKGFTGAGSGCTGVRDVSEYSTHNPSGTTVSQPSTILDFAPAECPYFTPSGVPYQGVMQYEGHRESLIPSSANWDLAQNLITEYGTEDGWAEMNRIWYGSIGPTQSAYQIVSGGTCNPSAQIDGCGSSNWYTAFLVADDDDGNLANGTPNACRIWDAYEAHGIACGSRPTCTGGAAPGFSIAVLNPDGAMCSPGSVDYNIDVGSNLGFTAAVTLTVNGLPTGVTASFSVNPVTPGNSTVLTLTGDATAIAGDYNMTVDGTATGADPESAAITLDISAGVPTAPVLTGPADGAIDVSPAPTFSWQAVAGANSYTLEVATDAAFTSIVLTQSGIASTTYAATGLAPLTTYYWRVTAENACGVSAPSIAFSFTTANLICSAPNLAIPDGDPTGVTDSLVVSQTGTVAGMQVVIRANHTWVGDTSFVLSNGTDSVTVIDRPGVPVSSFGCSGDNIDVTLDDAATASVEDACNASSPAISGVLEPNNPISATFAGQPLNDTWTLTASDAAAGDSGSLTEWCLQPVAAPPAETFTIGGTVTGLSGSGLVLQLNGAQDLAISADGAFVFGTGLLDGESYVVSVLTQPAGQVCTVSNGSGTIATADVSDVQITCGSGGFSYTVGGTVSGLTGSGMVLQLNGGTVLNIGADGGFVFPDALFSGDSYAVTVLTQPSSPENVCTVSNGSGTIAGANVTDVAVVCILPVVDLIFCNSFESAQSGLCDFGGGGADIVSGSINLPVNNNLDGSTFDFVTQQYGVYSATRVDDINLYAVSGQLFVYWYADSVTGQGGVSTDGTNFDVLQSGDVIGPSSTISGTSGSLGTAWFAGADGYLGIAFMNEGTGVLNYGYLHITTTSPGGYPAQVLEWAYNSAGDPITIP